VLTMRAFGESIAAPEAHATEEHEG
jgi:hypothetical protein